MKGTQAVVVWLGARWLCRKSKWENPLESPCLMQRRERRQVNYEIGGVSRNSSRIVFTPACHARSSEQYIWITPIPHHFILLIIFITPPPPICHRYSKLLINFKKHFNNNSKIIVK